MEKYTHNLKMLLIDTDGNIILENEFLDNIKNTLCQSHTKQVVWNNTNLDVTINWHRKQLNDFEKHLMGDLFCNSIYDFDSVIINHAIKVISSIPNQSNYKIKIYMSRIIGDKTICAGSYGLV